MNVGSELTDSTRHELPLMKSGYTTIHENLAHNDIQSKHFGLPDEANHELIMEDTVTINLIKTAQPMDYHYLPQFPPMIRKPPIRFDFNLDNFILHA